jgi:hypothetical protein
VPRDISNAVLHGDRVFQYPQLTAAPEFAVDSETWSNVKHGHTTAILVVGETAPRGALLLTAGHHGDVHVKIKYALKVGNVARANFDGWLPLWLVSFVVVTHAQRRRRQKGELRRLNKQARKAP